MPRSAAEELREQVVQFRLVVALELILLGVIALALWPAGRLGLAASLAKGLGVLLLAVWLVSAFVAVLHRRFRIDLDDHPDAFMISNLVASGVVVAGWSAFAALAVGAAAAGAPVWGAALLHLLGLVTCWMACTLVAEFYPGSLYRYTNLPLSAAAYALFALLPAAARFLYGWFFRLW
ncbi:MAG TPA: hypothetical protein VHG91_16460 [Longimicrobium sp.]|nr:hypothetical protein [Longimicrobium sp.]